MPSRNIATCSGIQQSPNLGANDVVDPCWRDAANLGYGSADVIRDDECSSVPAGHPVRSIYTGFVRVDAAAIGAAKPA